MKILYLLIAGAVVAGPFHHAFAQSAVLDEALGNVAETPGATAQQPAVRGAERGSLLAAGILLVPESTNDRVMAFDPQSGDLIDADFIPSDTTNLSTPIEAIFDPVGNRFLVSDQLDDHVFAYDAGGAPLGVAAPAGGADVSLLDNVRGFDLDPSNGNLLVSVAQGANADSIAEFDSSGNYLGNRVAIGAGGLGSPFDVLIDGNEILVAGIASDAIHRYDAAGNPLANFAPVDTFPEQIAPRAGGGYFVGNFSGVQEGILEFDAAGTLLNTFNPAGLGGYRGVYELGNGNLLITNGGGVHEIDRSGNLIETKIPDVNARFINLARLVPAEPALPVPVSGPYALWLMIAAMMLAGLGLLRQRAG